MINYGAGKVQDAELLLLKYGAALAADQECAAAALDYQETHLDTVKNQLRYSLVPL